MDKTLGNRINIIRKEAGLNQKDFSVKLGIAYPTLSKYEQGHRTPEVATLIKIADLGQKSLDWLLTGEGPKNRGEVSERSDKSESVATLRHTISPPGDKKEDEKRVPESAQEKEQSIVQQIEELLANQTPLDKIRFAEPPGEEYDAEYKYTMRLWETQQLLSEVSKLPREKRADALQALLATVKMMSG